MIAINTAFKETILLQTADGGFVARVPIPPFKSLPDVVIWGSRTFKQFLPSDWDGETPIYKECFCYWIPPFIIGEHTQQERNSE